MKPDIYLYGMTVASTIHRIAGGFPALDTYGELTGTWQVPGGEAMNAAMVLGNLGLKTRIGGPHLGTVSGPVIRKYARKYGVDIGLVSNDPDWPGLQDMILVDDEHRTVFGRFGAYFSDAVQRWDAPDAESCAQAKVVCIDPWFNTASDLAARHCVQASTPYVTIDCQPDSYLAVNSAANVVSGEFRRGHFKSEDEAGLLERYCARSKGLVVFSSGSGLIRFGRAGQPVEAQPAFTVAALSTLGAGDVFRAGIAWGLFHGTSDRETIRFAAALAALACTRMPIADTAPSLVEVRAFLAAQ